MLRFYCKGWVWHRKQPNSVIRYIYDKELQDNEIQEEKRKNTQGPHTLALSKHSRIRKDLSK